MLNYPTGRSQQLGLSQCPAFSLLSLCVEMHDGVGQTEKGGCRSRGLQRVPRLQSVVCDGLFESLARWSRLTLQPLQQLHLRGHFSIPCFTLGTLSSTALFLYSPPGMPLRGFWTCCHLWSSSFSYVDWTSICLTTIAALSLVAMSCQLLGGRREWAIVRMMLSCQLEQRAWVAPLPPLF